MHSSIGFLDPFSLCFLFFHRFSQNCWTPCTLPTPANSKSITCFKVRTVSPSDLLMRRDGPRFTKVVWWGVESDTGKAACLSNKLVDMQNATVKQHHDPRCHRCSVVTLIDQVTYHQDQATHASMTCTFRRSFSSFKRDSFEPLTTPPKVG